MAHPGEQFYPQGVRWDDPIAQGTVPDLLAKAAVQYAARPAIEFRDRPISYAELESMVETAAAAFLRAGCGKQFTKGKPYCSIPGLHQKGCTYHFYCG